MFSRSLSSEPITNPQSGVTRDIFTIVVTTGITLSLIGALVVQQISVSEPQIYWQAIGLFGLGLVFYSIHRLKKRLSIPDRIEQQLIRCHEEGGETKSVHALVDSYPSALGWNTLIEKFSQEDDRQTIERRLASSDTGGIGSERLGRALRSLPEGLCVTDQRGGISFSNAAWENFLGSDPDTDNILTALASRQFSNFGEIESRILTGTRPAKWELMQGNSIHDGIMRIERTPLSGREGEQPGFVWTLKDVTQAALARDAHEQFLASATHELRTPLSNIKAYSESLIELDNIPANQQREFFNVIYSESKRLSRLLNELLDIQQLEAGSMTITVGRFDVHRMANELQDHFEPLLREKHISFSSRIAPDIRTIEADKEKIISAMVNLLGNAIKYTPDGGEVRFIAEQLESSVVLAVEDNGIGIADSEIAKIFDRFYRCADDRVAKLEGNGLGLSFAAEVARLHNGEITVESELNKGSRFALKLPTNVEQTTGASS